MFFQLLFQAELDKQLFDPDQFVWFVKENPDTCQGGKVGSLLWLLRRRYILFFRRW